MVEWCPMKKLLKKRSLSIGLVVLIALIVGGFFAFGGKPKAEETATVKRGDMAQEVFITGTVKTARKVSLSFDRSGSIKSLPYPVGTGVAAGTIVASLKNESEYAAVAEGKALVAIAEANLAKINQGTREEEVRLKEAEARKADVALQNAKRKTFSVLSDAYTAAEEALNRYADPFFSNDETATPHLTYSSGSQESYDAEQKRLLAGKGVSNLQQLVQSGLSAAPSTAQAGTDALATLFGAVTDLRAVQDLFITLGLTLRNGSSLDATTLADYRSRVTSARSALATALTSVQTQANTIRDDEAELDRVTRALELARAKATPETVIGAEQELAQTKAKLSGASASLEKTLIRAPFSGQISSRNVEIGETVQAGNIIMEFLGSDGFIIEANVPEADVTKLEKGAKAEVTLDAYGETVIFLARVSLVEPAATEIDGVPTYKTTFMFEKSGPLRPSSSEASPLRPSSSEASPRLRSGLTANLTIKNTLKRGALTVPARAIISENGATFVEKKLPNGTSERIPITTGIRNNRDVEILSGLREGDVVVIPTVK